MELKLLRDSVWVQGPLSMTVEALVMGEYYGRSERLAAGIWGYEDQASPRMADVKKLLLLILRLLSKETMDGNE